MDKINRRDFLEFVGAGAAWAVLPGGCGKEDDSMAGLFKRTRTTNLKVLVIGIDGATFDIIGPMVKAGRLGQFKGLMETGTYSRFLSQKPMFSPCLWTTMATGHNRTEHGILHFISKAGNDKERTRLISTDDRKRLALWNIVSAFKKSVGSVGWWVTWPAEHINGQIVSDRVAHSRWKSWIGSQSQKRLTYPSELFDRVKHLIVDPLNPPMEEIDRLVQLTNEEKEEMLAARKAIFRHWLSVFKFGYCAQRSYENIAMHMLEEGQPDLNLIFLIAVDPVCHTFWHYFKPEQFREKVDPAMAKRLGKLVPAMYEHNDRYLSELLPRIDSDTVVIMVSDHGFKPTGKLPGKTSVMDYRRWGINQVEELDRPVNVGMSGRHQLNGMFIASGGPIIRGAKFKMQPSIADITPTILALMGMPVGKDMVGRVLEEIIDPGFWAANPVRYIDSYEKYIERQDLGYEIEAGEERHLDYLRSLGYVK